MSWLSDALERFFTRDKAVLAANLIKKAGVMFLGRIAQAIWDSAKRNIERAEDEGGSGADKFKNAYEGIQIDVGGLHGASTFWAKIFIEILVMVLNQNREKLLAL